MSLYDQFAYRWYQKEAICAAKTTSGIVRLPCGSGKTMVGIGILLEHLSTVGSPVVIIVTNICMVHQWIAELRKYTTLNEANMFQCTSETKDDVPSQGNFILFTTYTMACKLHQPCGLLILDEVHAAPADKFRTVVDTCAAQHVIGLTATLVREDERIQDLDTLVGPVLYTATVQRLVQDGYLAKTNVTRLLTEFPPAMRVAYDLANGRQQIQMCAQNPTKFQHIQRLVHEHEAKQHKIIVCGDAVELVRKYAIQMKRPFLDGKVSTVEREMVFHAFVHTNVVNTIFVSRIADAAIDLPSANVLIQFDSHGGARRQEAQRLGRVMRPGKKAIFISLVTPNSREFEFAKKRTRYLYKLGLIDTQIDPPTPPQPKKRKRLPMPKPTVFRCKKRAVKLLLKTV